MRAQRLFHLPVLGPVMRTLARRRVRQVMRGFRRLKHTGQLPLPAAVMSTLTTSEVHPGPLPRWFVGAAAATGELAIRQYMLIRVMGTIALNNTILASMGGGGPVVFPLPSEWRRHLRTHGLDVAGVRSTIVWWAYVLFVWAYGVAAIGRLLLTSIRAGGAAAWRAAGRYAYFVALTPGNVPRPGHDGRSYDILSWYWAWPGRARDVSTLAHSVAIAPLVATPPVAVLPSGLPPLEGMAVLRFAAWGVCASTSALLHALVGRWGQAVILSEAAAAASLRLQHNAPVATEYLLHASNVVYRPLWTYEAAQRGATCSLYCYSTNSEPFKLADGYTTPLHSWQVMTWPRLLVWDRGQADFMRRCLGARAETVDIIEVGPIWFHSSPEEMPTVGLGAVAVFDVQPQRTSRRQSQATPHEYYAPPTAKAFLSDIVTVAAEYGRPVVFKRKRRAGPIVHRGYNRLVDSLADAGRFTPVDPDISAVRVVESCEVVISMAFTSTGLLGRAHGKPSVYYDPLGMIQPDDRASHGVPIIQGIEALRAWFRALNVPAEPGQQT